jgi:hypothetical protein
VEVLALKRVVSLQLPFTKTLNLTASQLTSKLTA